MAERPLQQHDKGEREDDGQEVDGNGKGHQDRHTHLSHVVPHGLAGQGEVTNAGGRIRGFPRRQQHPGVDNPLQHPGQRNSKDPGRGVGPGPVRGRQRAAGDRVEGERSCSVGQRDHRGTERAPVQRELPDAPLRQYLPQDRHQQRVDGRKQDRYREFPDAVDILDDPSVLTGPPVDLYRGGLTGNEDRQQDKIATRAQPGAGGKANGEQAGE